MPLGPGRYDELVTYVREQAHAKGAIVLIFDGWKGSGFSCQLPALETLEIPQMLRRVADEIEASFRQGTV